MAQENNYDFYRNNVKYSDVQDNTTNEETALTWLLIEAGGVFNPRAVAQYLVKNGVCIRNLEE